MKLRLQPRSIAFRLIVAVLAVELLSSILVVVLSFGYERHIHFRAFDIMLHGRADSILGAVQDANDPEDNVMLNQADLRIPPEDIYEVWDANGRLLGRSSNWQDTGNWQGAGPGAPTQPPGDFSQLKVNGRHYRILRIQGSRTVDPGEHGGGKLRQVTILYGSPTSHVWHAIRGAVEFYAAGSVLLLLVTGPLIAWLLHRGLLPLRQLAALASQVSVDSWQFTPPASAYTTPELAPLTQALQSVLERLERSFLQQRAFVSDAAHELKTAVAVQKSSLQLLNMKRRSPQEYQAGLERCLADSLRLEELVADMLSLARAESTTPTDGPAPKADLAECIRQAVTQLEGVAALRDVRVVAANVAESEQPSEIPVRMAPEDCTLLVSNLLLNALQHSPPASAVELRLAAEAKIAVLVIQDHGDGIAAEALPHVFDRFYRGDPSRTRNTGGTGLGLAISKAIANKAGGCIEIDSQPDPNLPNQGTTVTVRLPIAG
ncbi:MAG TPA: ATP-binding protein [Terracidiphilus sp.]|nr:ATP-binding protein [Terracidiphilus sp.]